jgi:hypothetical protein
MQYYVDGKAYDVEFAGTPKKLMKPTYTTEKLEKWCLDFKNNPIDDVPSDDE